MTTRAAGPGEIRLAVIVDDVQYHAWIPMERIDDYLDAMERRLDGGAALRSDRMGQMSLRQWVARSLRERGRAMFDDVGGAAALWLALRHYDGGDDVRRGIDDMAATGATLTVSIGTSPRAAEGTAWAFMVGSEVIDGRTTLDQHDPEIVRVFGPGTSEGWRGRTTRHTS